MNCTKENCIGFDSCVASKYYESGECEKRKVSGKIDDSIPDELCKRCCYLASMSYCTYMREESLHNDCKQFVAECEKIKMEIAKLEKLNDSITQFGCVYILKKHLMEDS